VGSSKDRFSNVAAWTIVAGVLAAATTAVMPSPAEAVAPTNVALPGLSGLESEPNGTPATATPIAPSGSRVRGSIVPHDDFDYYSFSASVGDRIYAATGTGSAELGDTVLDLLGPDGTTVIETDDDNGNLGPLSSSIAGTPITAAGTHYLRVTNTTPTVNEAIVPYDLYLQRRTGAPTPEVEANDVTPEALAGPPHVTGATGSAADVDQFEFPVNPGDTIFLSEDLDPERDGAADWNGRVGLGLFDNSILFSGGPEAEADPDSHALLATRQAAGNARASVSSPDATFGTYNLSGTVIPAKTESCRVYTSTGPATPIADMGITTSTINVTDTFDIARLALDLDLTHSRMTDLDLFLETPAGNPIALLTDVGPAAVAVKPMDVRVDDYAASGPLGVVADMMVTPEAAAGRLGWTRGEPAAGTWQLRVLDDTAGETGTLNSWSVIGCEDPNPPPAGAPATVFSSDFESGDGGFTHSGTLDEWERGLPASGTITTCASGASCWKTDLDGIYENNSSQELLSPPISLAGVTGQIELSWKQRYQMETARFDHFWVEVRQVGGATPRRVFVWDGPTMTQSVGNPPLTIQESAGWATMKADISSFAGQNVEVVFHVDSDVSISFPGVAIDDVRVTRFAPLRQLTVTTQGSGSGFVDSAPVGVDCGHNPPGSHTDCDQAYADGTSVTLTAHPTAETTFAGFAGGGCAGAGATCTVSMDQARSVAASFAVTPSEGGGGTGATGPTGPTGPTGDGANTAPETTVTKEPKAKLKLKGKRKKVAATYEFSSNEAGSTFRCSFDNKPAAPCTSPTTFKAKKGRHTFSVFAVDSAGLVDPTPATDTFRVKKPQKR
jgi:hypothetical protein